ncbi:tryptophan 7-halogenase [Stakelama sediminis]|uniref:Tryptophan halogenase n=1 Tax=Stakelama sediminis TaxID=463200 RepID=A0A840YUJ3_9SPHN|nr:tryptophan halogenase family protein [Stakelama sediminis]MBB5717195.1 tryptophan halogenase [Stakelama sediminis]
MITPDPFGNGPAAPCRVVILGGGTAGWMTAAALARHLPGVAQVTLVESEEIGIVGVGEATLPHIRNFVEQLGLDEVEFMERTHATFKLGIDFRDFGAVGERYIHPFGAYGTEVAGVPFHHYWLRQQPAAGAVDGTAIEPYSMAVALARAGRFAIPYDDGTIGTTYGYAYQFDATRFGPYLRDYATRRGVTRIEGRVEDVERTAGGDVAALHLADGRRIEGDLFIDCSGFRSLLLGKTMAVDWEDWSQWLPCDGAAALPCAAADDEIEPFTQALAMPAGWRWRIPLRHRIGNGYVFSSAYVSEDEACATILEAVEGEPLADPRVLRFRAGRRARSWERNVIGIGLSSGFLEPLESTSIYLVQMAIARLVELFPVGAITEDDRASFNEQVDMEYDLIRDFLILHYNATRRDDTPFWNHVRTMEVPDSLKEKLRLWRDGARVHHHQYGLFLDASWISVCLGQGLIPASYDPRADAVPQDRLADAMTSLKEEIDRRVAVLPRHGAFLNARSPQPVAS